MDQRTNFVTDHHQGLYAMAELNEWSPEQIAGRLAMDGTLFLSHETIDCHIGDDRARGGVLYLQLRGARKPRRQRSGRYDSRWLDAAVLAAVPGSYVPPTGSTETTSRDLPHAPYGEARRSSTRPALS